MEEFINYILVGILWIAFGLIPKLVFLETIGELKQSKKTALIILASLIFWPITILYLIGVGYRNIVKWWLSLPDE